MARDGGMAASRPQSLDRARVRPLGDIGGHAAPILLGGHRGARRPDFKEIVGQRIGLSTLLMLGAIVLLVSIAIGNSMGNRVLGQIAARAPDVIPSPIETPSPDSGIPLQVLARREHSALSVATDPGFPDPRVTPEPTPPPPPPPVPKEVITRPHSTPTPSPSPDDGETSPPYTSPPLPIPIVSHQPGDLSDPNGEPLPAGSPTPVGSFRPSPRPSTQ